MAFSSDLLIPVRRRTATGERFAWPKRPCLAAGCRDDRWALGALADDLTRADRPASVAAGREAPGAAVRVERAAGLGPEQYRLAIDPAGVSLRAGDAAGAFYGIQTLRDLVAVHGGQLPGSRIADGPDFRRRGVYLDCSRGKVPRRSTLEALIDRLARWKINELQLYIENVFTFRRHPEIGRGFSPFTPGDIAALQAYAARRHVRLVPSLASFGHLETILALPAYRALGEKPGHLERPGGTTLCPGDPRSIRLLADLYAEFLPLFRADDFNVCCDETWELGQGRSRRRARRIGAGRVYLDFLLKIRRLCERHGKRMNLWADIVLQHPGLLADVPRDLVMLNWDYTAAAKRAARSREIREAGLPLLVCPGTSGWRSHGSDLPNATANIARSAAIGRREGAEGMLITDWGDFGHRNTLGVSLHGLACGAAHAWHGAGVDDASFTAIFCRFLLGPGGEQYAESVRGLGSTDAFLAGGRWPPPRTYHMLVEPTAPGGDAFRGIDPGSPVYLPRPHRHSDIDLAGEAELRAALERLAGLPWGRARRPVPDAFAQGAWAAWRLAWRMDRLALERALAVKATRAGRPWKAAKRKALAEALRAMTEEFAGHWRAFNRPSRLRENLLLLRRAAGDAG